MILQADESCVRPRYSIRIMRTKWFRRVGLSFGKVGQLDPVGFEEEIARITAEGSDIGMPRSCYTMKLSQRGYNAKSALVGVIRQALN